MNSKERVRKAVEHQEPDRVPVHVWYHERLAPLLVESLGLSGVPSARDSLQYPFCAPGTYTELEVALGNDMLMARVGLNRGFDKNLAPGEEYTDEWEIRYRDALYYNEIVRSPLSGASDLASYRFPDPAAPERWTILDRLLSRYGNTHCIVCDMSSNLFECCYYLLGMEQFFTGLALDRPFIEELVDRLLEFDLEVARLAVARGIDILWLGSDLGSQENLLVSPSLWRELFKPRMATLIEAIKAAGPDVKVAYHSDGAIRPLIPDLVEIGIDMLNPMQPLAKGMNPASLKEEFGDRLALHGGIDTQVLMPHGSAAEVRATVQDTLKTMMPGGGYILAAAQSLQPDVPVENVLALLESVQAYGRYG